MAASTVVPGPRTLVFDTGPLWELVLYAAARDLGFDGLRRELIHLREESSYRKFAEFVESFRRKTTTPHVVAEISSRVRGTSKTAGTERRGQSAIWGVVYTEFSSMRMDESLLKLVEMPQELVAEIGAVDTSVLKLGSSLGRQNSVVISMDGKLVAECKRAGVGAQALRDIVAG